MGMVAIRTWSVTCPRCKTHNQSQPLKCDNCDSKDVRLEASFGSASVTCAKCAQSWSLKAICEKCGANLSALAANNVGSQVAIKVIVFFLVSMLALMLLIAALS